MNTTAILDRIRAGDRAAESELMAHIYDELRSIARGYMRRERRAHTLQATELAHEVLVRVGKKFGDLRDGTHLRACLKRAMHDWLIDCARRRATRERARPFLVAAVKLGEATDLVDLATALEELAKRDARASDVIQYRAYLGLTIDQTARCVGVSHGTVESDYRRARAWVYARLRTTE
jgi:RNA polymerase sigma factor (TIGR02999 family)